MCTPQDRKRGIYDDDLEKVWMICHEVELIYEEIMKLFKKKSRFKIIFLYNNTCYCILSIHKCYHMLFPTTGAQKILSLRSMVPSHRPRHVRAILDLQAQVNKKLRKKSRIANRLFFFWQTDMHKLLNKNKNCLFCCEKNMHKLPNKHAKKTCMNLPLFLGTCELPLLCCGSQYHPIANCISALYVN